MDPATDAARCCEQETKSNFNHEQEPINMPLNSADITSALPTNQDPRDMHLLREAALVFWTATLLAIALPMCLVDWIDVDDAGTESRFWIHIVLAQFVALTVGLWWRLGTYCH